MPAGRPRKPTALRIVEGNRGHRALPKSEPQPVVGVPAIPPIVAVDPVAAAYWEKSAAVLGAVAGWVTHDMERQLTEYALLQAQRDRLVRFIRENGDTYEAEFIHDEGKDNEVLVKSRKRHPETLMLKETRIELRNLETAMGIGPVYRAKVDLSGAERAEDDVLEAL